MNYDSDAMFRQVAALAAKGWKIVRLWGVRDNGTCTCGRVTCATPGKHPHGEKNWQYRATDDEDEIARWSEDIEEHTRCNYGVRLGASSGIIDVEFDSPEAELVLKQYGLDKIDTPAYSSGRGVHRIFQYEDWMPKSAVVKVNGLEVRIGGGEAAGQSVIPPSWHKTGTQYAWLPGRSPEDVNPARLPDEFRDAVLKSSRKHGSGLIAQARETLLAGKKVPEGGRHPFLIGAASLVARNFTKFTDEERQVLTQIMLSLNATFCDPPKSHDEACGVASDQFSHYQKIRLQKKQSDPLSKCGLEWNAEERRWDPGSWGLTIVHSNPAEYKLRVPDPKDKAKRITIRLGADKFVSSRDVAIRVLDATKTVNLLDPSPERWRAIWVGESERSGTGGWDHIRGLNAVLLEDADHEEPPPENNVSAHNAGILLAYLKQFRKVESSDTADDKIPNDDGTPKWIFDENGWGLWLKWTETVRRAWRNQSLPVPSVVESRAVKEMIEDEVSESKIDTKTKKVGDGHQGRWFVFRDRHIAALEKLAGER